MPTLRPWFCLPLLALTASAQAPYNKHSFTVGMGAAQPRDDLKFAFSPSFVLGANYGYRFHRYFQLDAGVDTVFQAARIRDFLPTDFGDLRIRDYEFLVPVGGRVVMPLGTERIHLMGGGGAAYMRYSERLRQPFQDFRIDCAVCAARDGWGYYALLGGSVALDRDGHFRLGVESRVYRGHTEGDGLGSVAPVRTRDRWINILGTFSLSF